MNNGMNNYINPNDYLQQRNNNSIYSNYNNFSTRNIQVIRVNGKNGAQAYRLPPNSSILLLDETAPIIWLKMTDGAGYPTLSPYDITPHIDAEQATQLNTKDLENRIVKLEELVNGLYQSYDKSTEPATKRVIIKESTTS